MLDGPDHFALDDHAVIYRLTIDLSLRFSTEKLVGGWFDRRLRDGDAKYQARAWDAAGGGRRGRHHGHVGATNHELRCLIYKAA
jgi:hypothetical protein